MTACPENFGRSEIVAAVTFDVGGTLIQPWPSVGDVYAEVASHHGEAGLSVELLNGRFSRAWRSASDFNYARGAWAQLVDATFSGFTRVPPSRSFFADLYARFSEPDVWQIFPDVLPALVALSKRGLKLGVISNWDRRLIPLLKQLKLFDRFDAIVVSCNVRSRKPAPEIFAAAARRLGLPPRRVLHIGDSRDLDLNAARKAGLNALWLRREKRQTPRRSQIGTLGEIESRLIHPTDLSH